MDERPVKRRGRPPLASKRDSGGGSPVDPGLPLQPPHGQGSGGSSYLWAETRYVPTYPSLRHDVGGSPEPGGEPDRNHADVMHGGGLCDGDDGDRADRARDSQPVLSTPGALDSSELPDVANGYWGPVVEATAAPAGEGIRDGDGVLDRNSDDFDSLLQSAIKESREIINTPWSQLSETLQRIKSGLIQSTFTTGARVDENQLRKKQIDVLPRILEIMAQQRAKIPVVEATEVLPLPAPQQP